MKWRISCPYCGASYSVEADVFGKQCECGRCKQRFSVKAPDPVDVVPVAGERRRTIAPDPADDDPVDRRDDPLDERNHDFRFCPACGKRTIPSSCYCSYCGYSFWEEKSRDKSTDNRQFRYCGWCGRKLRATAEECPICEMYTCFDVDPEEQPKPARPFICGVLNVFGALIILPALFCVAASAAQGSTEGVFLAVGGVFFALILFGISSAIAQASRRW